MSEPLAVLIAAIALAIGLGVVNGVNDAANAIATVIGTRTLPPHIAVSMAAVCNFLGAATGTAVAVTIGKGIVSAEAMSMDIVVAGTAAIIIWGAGATRVGMPISLTHGLVAGLAGAGLAISGSKGIVWTVLGRVVAAVGIAPLLGLVGGFLTMLAILWSCRRTAPDRVQNVFRRLQIASAAFMAYSHGKNDGQMPIGLISAALMAYYGYEEFRIPFWVVIVSAAAISFGTALGGWRVIQTLGLKVTTLRPPQGFAAESSAAAVIELASHLGIPVSTTHCITTAIMGVGATRRLTAVKWGVARNIVLTWILTFPACGALGWLIASILKLLS
jgi:PiT family inorganic phosphate transporter